MAELLGREYFAAKDREFLKEAFSEIVDEVTLTIVRKPPSRIILAPKPACSRSGTGRR